MKPGLDPRQPPPDPRPGQARRWRLWALLCLLVALMLGALVFLAREYEEARSLEALEQDAATLGSDIRTNLIRNLQTLQSLHVSRPSAEAWEPMAAELLSQHRELVRLEWRANDLRLLAARDSGFHPLLFEVAPRSQSLADVRQACTAAGRNNTPSYSQSYFWPIPQGLGLELMEVCVPLFVAARDQDYKQFSQEIRLANNIAIDRAGAAKLGVRLVNHLVSQGKLVENEFVVGPDGGRLALEPTRDGKVVRVRRA